jgi:regulator of protease activity HflC (stomatin/prohibitin superfamily)
MFGFRYIKFDPTFHVQMFRKGKLVREGAGLAFWYFEPTTSLVSVPLGSKESHFIFEQVTADFQEVTVQGQVTYRISDPRKASQLLNYTLVPRGNSYASSDPEKLEQRVVNAINVLTRSRVQQLPLRSAIVSGESWALEIMDGLKLRADIQSLGLEILGLSIIAVRPKPETSRALEAETREQLMREADDAVNARRNASVEQERSIKENELLTEKTVQEKRQELEAGDTRHRIAMEESRKALVALEAENAKISSDARGYALGAVVQALAGADPKVIQTLATVGMKPDALIAAAMGEFAANAERIGELNVSSELLQSLARPRSQPKQG